MTIVRPLALILSFAVGLSAAGAQDRLADILIDGENWELVAEGFKFTEGPAADSTGRLYFSDVPNNKIYRLNDRGVPEVFIQNSRGSNGLMFGPDGRLYACQFGKKRVVAYDSSGIETVIAADVLPNDLVVAGNGTVYFTEPDKRTVWYVPHRAGSAVPVDQGIQRPNGIILWPKQGTLVVADTAGQNLWTFRIDSNGLLSNKERFYAMLTPPDRGSSGADGMTVDTECRVYVATFLGVQVFDVEGRLIGIIQKPQSAFLSNLTFAGPKFDSLYATSTDKLFRRKTKATGVRYTKPEAVP
ncbi:MAG: SMP-30/gluconolactonase/LRE family protein [Pirellulales bacterium]|nr:SMP-30/gluconolactonase/LRE family protein [Pirellulales bacterium]